MKKQWRHSSKRYGKPVVYSKGQKLEPSDPLYKATVNKWRKLNRDALKKIE